MGTHAGPENFSTNEAMLVVEVILDRRWSITVMFETLLQNNQDSDSVRKNVDNCVDGEPRTRHELFARHSLDPASHYKCSGCQFRFRVGVSYKRSQVPRAPGRHRAKRLRATDSAGASSETLPLRASVDSTETTDHPGKGSQNVDEAFTGMRVTLFAVLTVVTVVNRDSLTKLREGCSRL